MAISRKAPTAYDDIAPQEITYRERVGWWQQLLRFVGRVCWRHRFTLVPFLILLAALGYYYVQYQKLLRANAPQAAQVQTQKIVGDIEKLMYVGNDTGAQLAVITDVTKLQGQNFFVGAQNGDDLVIFPAEQKAVIYRPSNNKIVNIGPYSASSGSAASATAPSTVKAQQKPSRSAATSSQQ